MQGHAGANLMPEWLAGEQFRQDSIRAVNYFKLTNDTSVIRKFIPKGRPLPTKDENSEPAAKKDSLLKPKMTFKLKKPAITA